MDAEPIYEVVVDGEIDMSYPTEKEAVAVAAGIAQERAARNLRNGHAGDVQVRVVRTVHSWRWRTAELPTGPRPEIAQVKHPEA